MGGGVTRMKQHIAGIKGQVSSCMMSTPDQQKRCREAYEAPQVRKRQKHQKEEENRAVVTIDLVEAEGNDEEFAGIGNSEGHKSGPLDKFVKPIDPSIPVKKFQQQNISDAIDKDRSYKVGQYLARWIYKKNVPFNAINDDDFKQFCEALGRYGPKWKPPSQHLLREKMLLQEVERTRELMKPHEIERVATGCSIMTDAWTDKKRRSIMNLCVHCKLGTSFLESKEASADAHTSEYIFNYVLESIDKIGINNGVQIVTDNASNNMGAKSMLKEKFPQIFWTSCATHTLNLIVEAIGKLKQFAPIIIKAKEMTIFIYAHHKTLSLMRFYTRKRYIVRPGVTRFASAFLTLQSLIAKKKELRAMACSDAWEGCKHTRTKKGKSAHATIMSRAFWNGVSLCIKVFEPLVKLLRLADSDGPSKVTMYGELLSTKKAIMAAVENSEKDYLMIIQAMDMKMKGRLDSPLHIAAFMLNPKYSYADSTIFSDVEVVAAFMEVMEQFYHDDDEKQNIVLNIDFTRFKNKKACLGRWLPQKQLAMLILMLVDAKRRNRLDIVRRDNLVYIQFNVRCIDKRMKLSSATDVLLGEDALRAQDWIVEGAYVDEEIDPVTGLSYSIIDEAMGATEAMELRRSARVRELHEVEEFVSDDDNESDHEIDLDDDIEYEFDDDGVMATKDAEDEDDGAQP
ncbi:hypothetical protein ACQ4PT_044662 [Festuca glaucescens]